MSGQTITKGNFGINSDDVALIQRQYVYDPVGLTWVPEQQASGGAASTVNQGTAAAGSSAWPVTVTEDSTHTKVEPGDATNKAIRVNIVAGSSSGTQYTEDLASTTDPIGTAVIYVRDDARAGSLTSTNGDYVILRGNNSGEIYVKHTDAIAITNTLLATNATGLGKAEDAAHVSGDTGVMSLAVRNDTGAVLAGSDGDYIPFTVDSTGALRTDLNGTVSTNNSSVATLLAAAVFTGTSDDVLNYNEIRVSVIASHASATDGLSIQQSSDNSNWDITDTYTIPATTGKTYAVPRQARYFRLVYTNGGTNQTSFRLQTILNRLGSQASSQRPGDGYTNETDLEQVQSFGMGWNGTTWDRIKATSGKLLVTPDSVALPANQSVNVAQMNGTTVSMNSGNTGVGTLRVIIATDQPQLTNKLLVTPDSVALPANQSVNLTQMNSTTVTMGAGTSNVGVQRVIIATDQPSLTNKLLVTPDSVALPANQSVNVAQMNGTTTSMDAGATGVGTQRVILANNSSAIANWGQGATGTTVPTGAQYNGLNAVTALPTAVATGQMAAIMGDVNGRQVTMLGTIRTLRGSQATTISNTTVETTILTGTTNIFADISLILITNTSTTASCRVDIRDTTGGTVIAPLWAPTGQTVGFAIPGGSWPQTSVGGNWTAQCSAVVTDIRIAVLFDKNR